MRRGSIFWGLVLTLAGVLLLLNTMGMLPAGFGAYFWPLVIVLLGVWLIVSPRMSRGELKEESASFPLESATAAEIDFHHGAGKLRVEALQEPLQLAAGTFVGGVTPVLRRDGSQVYLSLKTPEGMFAPPPIGPHFSLDWNLGLTREIPLRLAFHTGASETALNLADLRVESLRIETGASATRVILPANAGFTRVSVEAGAASIDLTVPEGVAARIKAGGGLSGIHVNTSRFPQTGGVYETPAYETYPNRAEITLETGVGSVDIH
jgi:hypothetical protein